MNQINSGYHGLSVLGPAAPGDLVATCREVIICESGDESARDVVDLDPGSLACVELEAYRCVGVERVRVDAKRK